MQVTGQGGMPSGGVGAVVVTLTSVDSSGVGRLSVAPADEAVQGTTALHYQGDGVTSNTYFAKLSADGRIRIKAYGSATDVLVDVQGWFATPLGGDGAAFTASGGSRVLDTREAFRAGACPSSAAQCTALVGGVSRTVQVAGRGGVPASGVAAVAVTLIAVNPAQPGRLLAWRSGDVEPVGTVGPRYAAGVTESVTAVVELDGSGRIDLEATGDTDVVVDVQGWFASSGASRFRSLVPQRVLDTRGPSPVGSCPSVSGSTSCSTVPADSAVDVQVGGRGGVPTVGVGSVVLNVVSTGQSGSGRLEVFAQGDPSAGSEDGRVYFEAGVTIGSSVVVPVNAANGRITVRAVGSASDVVLDVQGWFGNPMLSTVQFSYDGDGLRRSKTGVEGTVRYGWSPTAGLPLLLSETVGVSRTYYLYGPSGTPFAQVNPDNTIWYLHADQLGSVRTVTNAAGTTIGTFTYDAYGQQTDAQGTARPAIGYAGQYTDIETGLQYLRARYYDPGTGQFLSRDPITTITRSPYGYVSGDPLNATDPSGLCGWRDPWDCVTAGTDIALDTVSSASGDLGCGTPPVWMIGQAAEPLDDLVDGLKEDLDEWAESISVSQQLCTVLYCWTQDESGAIHGRWSIAAGYSVGFSPPRSTGNTTTCHGLALIAYVAVCHDPNGWYPILNLGIGVFPWARGPA